MPVKIENVLSWGSDVEPGTIEQAAKASRMPFVKGHLALMADSHIGMGATIGSVIPTEGAIMPSAVGVDIGCFVGDTKVALLNGRQMTLQEMAESEQPWFWVYSMNSDGNIVPGKAVALKTRINADLMRITVSGGDEITCTADHKFMLRDGSYKEAVDLTFNESLMPLYRKWSTRDGYERVSSGKGTAVETHKMVYAWKEGTVPQGFVIHHKNHFHFDNSPENLEPVEIVEHSRHHRKTGHTFANGSAEFQRKRVAGIREAMERPGRLEQMVAVGTKNIVDYMKKRPEHFKAVVAENGKRGAKYLAKFNTSPRTCENCGDESPNPSALQWHKRREHAYNHKVIDSEFLEETADVYCLQVEDHHNFALAAGVFVHNCGMIAVETDLSAGGLPDDMDRMLSYVGAVVPSGVGKGHTFKNDWDRERRTRKVPSYTGASKLTGKQVNTITEQFGTLGSGNHFVEICLDERDRVWVVLHSGSRGIGNQLATQHIKIAKKLMKDNFIQLEDPDLAYLVEGSDEFKDYLADMLWSQEYARANREAMMDAVLEQLWGYVGTSEHTSAHGVGREIQRVNCHHNFAIKEQHMGRNVWLTRKGAVRARVGDMAVIPGSMGTRSYIARGLGNAASYNSCSHGAGRRLSRTKARETLTVESLNEAMGDRTWNSDHAKTLLDEAPAAYKSIDQVMADQLDLVEIVHTLRSILNYKGVS